MVANPVTTLKRVAPRWVTARSEAAFRTTFDAPPARVRDTRVPFVVLMFMGHGQVPQAVASLRTFLEFAGRPNRLVITSDGTLDDTDRTVLRRVASVVEFPDLPDDDPSVPGNLAAYARAHPLGRKLLSFAAIGSTTSEPLLYFDTDLLFFPGASTMARTLLDRRTPAFMAEANRGAFDPRADLGNAILANSGFVFLPEPVDWPAALAPHAWLLPEPVHFTEQTIVNLILADLGATPLDPTRFLLEYSDARSLRDVASAPGVVARHYVAPIRWKMWVRAAGGVPRSTATLLSGRWFGRV